MLFSNAYTYFQNLQGAGNYHFHRYCFSLCGASSHTFTFLASFPQSVWIFCPKFVRSEMETNFKTKYMVHLFFAAHLCKIISFRETDLDLELSPLLRLLHLYIMMYCILYHLVALVPIYVSYHEKLYHSSSKLGEVMVETMDEVMGVISKLNDITNCARPILF